MPRRGREASEPIVVGHHNALQRWRVPSSKPIPGEHVDSKGVDRLAAREPDPGAAAT
jgi:hypothetical protein